LKIQEQI